MRTLLAVILLFVFSSLLYSDDVESEVMNDFSPVVMLLERMIELQESEHLLLEQQTERAYQVIVQGQYQIGLLAFFGGILLAFVLVFGMRFH